MRRRSPHTVFVLLAALWAGGCDWASSDGTPRAGDRLAVTDYADAQPSSRAGYAAFGAIGDYGSVWLYDLGSGPDDPPRLVRSIRMAGVLPSAAQVDARGYVWVAAPYVEAGGSGASYTLYVVDPHAGTVHRALDLPLALGTVDDVAVYDDAVFFRSVGGGVGRVDPACAVAEARCAVSPFAALANTTGARSPSLLRVGGSLYAASTTSDANDQPGLERVDTATGDVVRSAPFSGRTTTDGERLYLTARLPSDGPTLLALRLDDLGVERSRRIATGAGFVAPDVLMLNGTAALDVSTGRLLLDPARGSADLGSSPGALRLPQGHPLAY